MSDKIIPIINTIPVQMERVNVDLKEFFTTDTVEDEDKLRLYARLQKLGKAFDDVKKNTAVKENIYDAIDYVSRGDGKANIDGVEISTRNGRAIYNYGQCGHTEYNFILEAIEVLNKRRKQIEEELKAIPQPDIKSDKDGNVHTFGGEKDIPLRDDILRELQFILENSDFAAGDIVTCTAPTKLQDTNIIVRNLK